METYETVRPNGVRVISCVPFPTERLADRYALAHLPLSYSLWARKIAKGVRQELAARR